MTVYVDGVSEHTPKNAQARRWGTKWSHMWCDENLTELHEMAEKIGLKREYFQDHYRLPHYDLIPSKRLQALRNGAVEMSLKEFEMIRSRATEYAKGLPKTEPVPIKKI